MKRVGSVLSYLALFAASWWVASPDHPPVLIPIAVVAAVAGAVLFVRSR